MELRDYINVIRARKWVIIQAVVIVTLVAALFSLVQPKAYEGTAEILISEKDTASAILGNSLPLSAQPERALQTEVQLVQIRPVAEAAIKQLNLQETSEELLKHVSVDAVSQTNIVRVTASDADPKRAAQIANAVADYYVRSARDAQREAIAAAADEVQKRLDDARTQIIDLGHRIQTSGQSSDLAAQLQIATGTYSTLAEKLEQLRINEQLETGPGRVVTAAVADNRAVSPKPARDAALGAVLGLVLGLGLAYLYEYLDSTVKSTAELERVFGAPVLGTIPAEKMEKGEKRRLAIVQAPGSSVAEAYRVVRNSLDFINFQNDIKTIVVTSAAPGEGKSTVAANLAAALAQAGKKVVLVGVDFRRPTTDQFFPVTGTIGRLAKAGRRPAVGSDRRQDAAEPLGTARLAQDAGGPRGSRRVGRVGHHRLAAAPRRRRPRVCSAVGRRGSDSLARRLHDPRRCQQGHGAADEGWRSNRGCRHMGPRRGQAGCVGVRALHRRLLLLRELLRRPGCDERPQAEARDFRPVDIWRRMGS